MAGTGLLQIIHVFALLIGVVSFQMFTLKGDTTNEKLECRCKDQTKCTKEGECLDNICMQGYFGPKCQYKNVVLKGQKAVREYSRDNGTEHFISELNDENITTYFTVEPKEKDSWIYVDIYSQYTRHARIVFAQVDFNNASENHSRELLILEDVGNVSRYVNKNVLDLEWQPYYNNSIVFKIPALKNPLKIAEIYINGGRDLVQRTRKTENVKMLEEDDTCLTPTDNQSIVISFNKAINIYKYQLAIRGTNDSVDLEIGISFHYNDWVVYEKPLTDCDNTCVINVPVINVTSTEITLNKTNISVCQLQILGDVFCPKGKWGVLCQSDCNCKSDHCFFFDGKCEQAIPTPQKGPCHCVTNCSMPRDCGECIDGFQGYRCENKCVNKCKDNKCLKNGSCSFCQVGLYNSSCTQKCPLNCMQNACEFHTGDCFNCKNGFFGRKCQYRCSRNCVKTDYRATISKQFYQYTCSRDSGTCFSCRRGYFSSFCNKTCSKFCFYKHCEQISGQCVKCKKGNFGKFCEKRCPRNCLNGKCLENGTCNSCKNGFQGPLCENPCSTFCSSNMCDQTLGYCIPCLKPFFGKNCVKKCSQNCENETCVETTGECYTCKMGWHGKNCQYACDPRCKDKKCKKKNGVCEKCYDSYFGDYCELNCFPACTIEHCNYKNSPCFECENHKFGKFCNESCGKNKNCKDPSCCKSNVGVCICTKEKYQPHCTFHEFCKEDSKEKYEASVDESESSVVAMYTTIGFFIIVLVAALLVIGKPSEVDHIKESTKHVMIKSRKLPTDLD